MTTARENDSTEGVSRQKSKAASGQTVFEDYGLDKSSKGTLGNTKMTRGPELKGSSTSLGHSLSGGVSAHQGPNKGNRSNVKER